MSRLKITLLALVLTFGMITPFFMTDSAEAVTGDDWRAGRIIDDDVFTNKSAMSVAEIQRFLNTKMPDCDTNGSGMVGGVTRAQYGAARGNPAPFTCLRDYYEVPKTAPGNFTPKNNYGGKARPDGARSAARLIWDAAQKHSISPKVLLVTLQKEQSLLTDDWPFRRQFMYAMGAYCPDGANGAECDPNYRGFSIQMLEGAELFRYYLDNMNQPWWSYKKPYRTNYILWNVQNTSCGGSNVFIENKATAALYTYTPYQPNQAALDNLYGTGNGCSAYGNRNFWRIFNDWFGTTLSQRLRLISCGGENYIIEPYIKAKRQITDDGLEAWGLSGAYFKTDDGGCSYPSYVAPLDVYVASRTSGKKYLVDLSSAYQIQSQSIATAWDIDLNQTFPMMEGKTINTLNVHSKLPRIAESANTSKVYLLSGGKIHEIVGTDSQALVRGYDSVPMDTFSGTVLSNLKNANGAGGAIDEAFRVGSQWYTFDHGKVRSINAAYYSERWSNLAAFTGPELHPDTVQVFPRARQLLKGFQRSSNYFYVGLDGSINSTANEGHARVLDIEDAPVVTSLLLEKLTE